MDKFNKTITSPFKKMVKNNNMTAIASHIIEDANFEINNSIMRGEILRYAQISEEVRHNLQSLKNSNPKYLNLIIKIIELSINELPAIDIDMHARFGNKTVLDILLSQLNYASYNNQEALDFTDEIINNADKLTSKFYLAHLAAGTLQNNNLKKQFRAATPFVKYILASLDESYDLSKQNNFMKAVKIIINENADENKINLLPKVKYTIDNISKHNYPIDITRFIHNEIPYQTIIQRLETITTDFKAFEKRGIIIDCVDYLLNPELVIS